MPQTSTPQPDAHVLPQRRTEHAGRVAKRNTWNDELATGPKSLVEMLRTRTLHRPDHVIYTFLLDGEEEGPSLSYSDLDRQARAIAVTLLEHCKPGDRAMLVYPPGLEYIAAFFGCLYAGVVAVPVYPPDPMRLKRTLPRFQVVAVDCDPAVVLTTGVLHQMGEALSTMAPELAQMKWLATDIIDEAVADAWVDPKVDPETIAFLQYTSGSTADPKGVMVTHANLIYNLWDVVYSWEDEDYVQVTWLPSYHDMGLIVGLLHPVYGDQTCYFMSPLAFLQRPFRWLKAVSKYKAIGSVAPNFAYDLCVRKISPEQRASLDLSRWRLAGNGAEPIRPETLERFYNTFKPCGFRWRSLCPGYGLAEATLKVAQNDIDAGPYFLPVKAQELERHRAVEAHEPGPGVRVLVSCGHASEETRLLIVDPESCLQCGPDTVGEIWVAGPTVAKGYWRRHDDTERTFGASLADTQDGPFLRTGDLGFMKNGHLFVTGRLKDMIIIDGMNRYPQDIEHTVEIAHPAVRPGCCAAFSVDVDGRENLVVVVEVGDTPTTRGDSGSGPAYKEIITAIRRAISECHDLRVHRVGLIEPRSIHKTTSGKIMRQACRADYLSGSHDFVACE